MRVYDVIDAKKNRRALTAEEIRFFVARVADGSATDSQIAAFCMATLLNGMTDEEVAAMTAYARRFQEVNDAILDTDYYSMLE